MTRPPTLDEADQVREAQLRWYRRLVLLLVVVIIVLALGRAGVEQVLQLWPVVAVP